MALSDKLKVSGSGCCPSADPSGKNEGIGSGVIWTHGCKQENQEMGKKQLPDASVRHLRSHGYVFRQTCPIDPDILTSDEEEKVDIFRSGNGSKSNLVPAATAFDYQT
ncbi:unnamed protein product [Sphagnum jensenii]|uniref:Uncharacterized protein n=1 Tax=Sphagnum jensenii TaxID=128206 RepID=A0ABP1BJH1_9BRYO